MIIMAGIDHSTASIRDREVFSFATHATVNVMSDITRRYMPSGCVVVSTCNRTEVYISATESFDLPEAICHAVGVRTENHRDKFHILTDREALMHLFEVACGIKSRVFGEEQILAQTKESIDLARKEGFTDSVLETAFRLAVTAAKKARTVAMPKSTKPSSATRAVEMASEIIGDLCGKNAVVIGSGEMGKLSANLLLCKGAKVHITTRRYKVGEVQVPDGAIPIPYEDRLEHIDGADIVISATRSPHFTLTLEQISALDKKPMLLVDLSMPRDIDPEIEAATGVKCINIDEIGWDADDNIDLTNVYEVFEENIDKFYEWLDYKIAHINKAIERSAPSSCEA